MPLELNRLEVRVLGCLLEKAKTTPDQYPLSLNSLTAACNQKSSRNPVMSLGTGEVQNTIRSLQAKRIVLVEENFKTQIEKYTHRFCNTPFGDYEFDAAQYAIVCVLLLRGARTPGELRANSARLHVFADNAEVVECLDSLCSVENACVTMLARSPGRRDNEYVHLFFGGNNRVEQKVIREKRSQRQGSGAQSDLERRVTQLEQAVKELRGLLE